LLVESRNGLYPGLSDLWDADAFHIKNIGYLVEKKTNFCRVLYSLYSAHFRPYQQ